MAKELTSLAIEKMKPGAERREIADGRISGLYFIIQPKRETKLGRPLQVRPQALQVHAREISGP